MSILAVEAVIKSSFFQNATKTRLFSTHILRRENRQCFKNGPDLSLFDTSREKKGTLLDLRPHTVKLSQNGEYGGVEIVERLGG